MNIAVLSQGLLSRIVAFKQTQQLFSIINKKVKILQKGTAIAF